MARQKIFLTQNPQKVFYDRTPQKEVSAFLAETGVRAGGIRVTPVRKVVGQPIRTRAKLLYSYRKQAERLRKGLRYKRLKRVLTV